MPAPRDQLDALGTMIRTARKKHGFSQDALASVLGIAQSHLSALESGGRRLGVTATLIMKMHEVLGLDIAELTKASALRTGSRHDSSDAVTT